MQTYSTADVPRKGRLTYWNDLHRAVFTPLEFTPAHRPDFCAAIRADTLGQLMISQHYSAPATIERSPRHVAATRDRRIGLLMPTQGPVEVCHYGRTALVREGECMLLDPLAPVRLCFQEPNRSIVLGIPYAVLAVALPAPEAFFGLRLGGGGEGFGGMVAALLIGLWTQVEQGLPAEFRAAVARSVVELVATAYAVEHGASPGCSSVPALRSASIKRYVEANLRDSALTPAVVAAAVGLSPRHARAVCAAERESMSAYILRRRLEECARELRSRQWRGRSITNTAFEWGFSSMAHFTRVFKSRYGMTPSEYRVAATRD